MSDGGERTHQFMNNDINQILSDKLINEEFIRCSNFSFVEECDCCHDYKSILNYHGQYDDFIEYNGIQFLCKKCRT